MRDLLTTGGTDIFMENFMPAKIRKLGLDYDSVKELNKSLVYASVAGFP